jgi:phosphopantetheinyl transferase
VEPTSNCSSASGGALFAVTAAVMQAVESQNLILYHTELRGEWPHVQAATLAARLRYPKRTALPAGAAGRASLAGIALAVRALSHLLGRAIAPGEIVFAAGRKPQLAPDPDDEAGAADFSISHAGPWVGCAALVHGRVGLDIETGTEARIVDWVAREALLKATGVGMRGVQEVRALPLQESPISWRGAWWHLRRLEEFAGAAACVASSRPAPILSACQVPLAELFAA